MSRQTAVTRIRWDDLPLEQVSPRLARRYVCGERVMLAQMRLAKGCLVPTHHHHHEQLSYILEGALKFRIGEHAEEEIVVRAGEVLLIPSNVPHMAEALEDTVAADVFAPPREDWVEQRDDYLRDA